MLFPKALDLHRPKRPRTTFSATQLAELEKEYEHNPYLIGEERANLAEKLNLTDTQVRIFFFIQRYMIRNISLAFKSTSLISITTPIE